MSEHWMHSQLFLFPRRIYDLGFLTLLLCAETVGGPIVSACMLVQTAVWFSAASRHLEHTRFCQHSETEPIPWAATGKFGRLDTWPNSFPPQGEDGIWGFSPSCSVLSRGRGYGKCLHASQATIFVLRGSESGSFPVSAQIQTREKPAPRVASTNIRTLDIWSSPFPPFPGRIWELGICSQSCDAVLGEGLWLGSFSISFDMVGFLFALGAGASRLVSGFITKGVVGLCRIVQLVCPWGEGVSRASYSSLLLTSPPWNTNLSLISGLLHILFPLLGRKLSPLFLPVS